LATTVVNGRIQWPADQALSTYDHNRMGHLDLDCHRRDFMSQERYPPELSPLDAFAAQSRLLAKQLEESANGGKRMSRLPPLTIANLNQSRPGFFRSASAEATTPLSPTSPGSGLKTEVETPGFRPVSRISYCERSATFRTSSSSTSSA
jgi:hypothetical protein